MDLIGKILVVLVLVLSVLFLTWAMLVYGTHTNLRTEAEDLERQASQEQNNQLAEEASHRRDQIDENQRARDEALVAVKSATEQIHQLQGQLAASLERNRDLKQDLSGR